MYEFLDIFGLDEETTDVTNTNDHEVSEMLIETLSDDFGVDVSEWTDYALNVVETEEGYTITAIGFK